MRGFLKFDFEVVAQVITTLGLTRVGATTSKEILENAASSEDFPEDVERVMEPACTAEAASRAPIESGVAVLVISPALLWITQDLIGFAEFLELFLRSFIARVFVRMVFNRQFPVSLLDFFSRGALLKTQNFVVIAFSHELLGSRLRRHDDRSRAEKTVPQPIALA
jgi:hypothetical protein